MQDNFHFALKQLEASRANLSLEVSPSDTPKRHADEAQEGAQGVPLLDLTAVGKRLLEAEANAHEQTPNQLTQAAAEAAEAANAASRLVNIDPQLLQDALALVAEAARALAQLQHRRAVRAAAQAAKAKEAGTVRAAVAAAMEAGEAAGLVVRAASIGGHSVMQRLRDAQEEALRAAEAAAEDAWATQQAAQYRAAAQAAAQAANAGKPAEVPDVSSGPQISTCREGGSSGQAADSSDSATGVRPLAGSRAAASSGIGGASLGATAALPSGPASTAAPTPEVALVAAPEAALLAATEAYAREPLSIVSTAECGGNGPGDTAAGLGPRRNAAPAAARGPPSPAESVSDVTTLPPSVVRATVPSHFFSALSSEPQSFEVSYTETIEVSDAEVSDAESSEGSSSSFSLDMLSLLAGTAHIITPEGGLPPAALLVASQAADGLLGHKRFYDTDAAVATQLTTFFSPLVRTGIMQLVSVAVRRVADGPVQPGNELSSPASSPADAHASAQHEGSWQHWQRILRACLYLLTMAVENCRSLESVSAELRARVSPGVAAVTSVMLRTDLLPALSRVLAAATAAAQAFAGCAGEGSGLGSGGSGGGDRTAGDDGSAGSSRRAGSEMVRRIRELQAWSSVVRETCEFVTMWRTLCMCRFPVVAPAVFTPALRLQLVTAICNSHVLDHAARAIAALLGPLACRAALGFEAQLLFQTFVGLAECACTTIPESEEDVLGILADDDQRALPLLAFCSPCLQHLLLLHTVAQLCAVDGGTDYGLPPEAALPAIPGGAYAGPHDECTVFNDEAVCSALKCWAAGAASPQTAAALLPCERRHLWLLCMRVIDAAVWSSESDDDVVWRFVTAEGVELRALMLAVALAQGDPAVGSMDGLWAPAVRAVRRVLQEYAQVYDMSDTERLLLAPRLPAFPYGCPLPAEPPADVSAALASGYVACLEMALRFGAREPARESEPHEPEHLAARGVSRASRLVRSLRCNMALLAYEEPRTIASVVTTGAKLMRRGLAEAAKALAADPVEAGDSLAVAQYRRKRLLATCADLASSLDPCTTRGNVNAWCEAVEVSREDEHWWAKRRAVAVAATGDGGGAGGGTGGSSSGCGNSGGGAGSGGRDGDGGGRLPPLQQQMLLLSWALAQWLPAVARGALAMLASSASACVDMLNAGVIPWVPPLVLAYLDCKAAAAEAAASGAAAKAAEAEAEAAVTSWGRVLLQDMAVMRVVAEAVAHALGETAGMPPDCIPPGSPLDALTHVAVAFPDVARITLLYTYVGEPGRALLDLLQPWAAKSNGVAARFFAQVITTVGAGGSPPASAVAQLRSGAWRGADPGGVPGAASWVSSALRAAPLLLPPPCVAAALLRLPLCANPGCTNLEGDSEVGLRLSGCGRCRGAVAYCSRECQVAHWRAGHKEECCAR